MTRARPLLCIALGAGAVLGLAWAPAALAAPERFVSPSRNIGCIGTNAFVRCDIAQTRATPPPRPASCRLDWGTAFEVERRGRGHGLCAGDTALPSPGQRVRVLRYGTTIRLGNGLRCTSRRTGLTCLNQPGHGFFLSRGGIRVF
jgi:hypothetical protein